MNRISVAIENRKAAPDGGISCVLSTDTPIIRGHYTEILDHGTGAVDLERAAQGLALLLHHDQTKPVGRIEGIKISAGKLRGIARFGTSAEAQQALADVESGILPSLSVGYSINETREEAAGVIRVTHWTPHEASLVAIPADIEAGMNRSNQNSNFMEKHPMQTANQTVISELCKRHHVTADLQSQLLEAGDLDAARTAIMEAIAARDSVGTMQRQPYDHTPLSTRDAITNAILNRVTGSAEPTQFESRASLVDMAVQCLEDRGDRVGRNASKNDIVMRAMTISDFPAALGNTVGRVMQTAYDALHTPIKSAARIVLMNDFRDRRVIRIGDGPRLEKVNEHGEFKHGPLIEDAASGYGLKTFGKIFALSRQAIVNDDVAIFQDIGGQWGRATANFEARQLTDLLLSNPVLADTSALFHADHGNLVTGTGSALTGLTPLTVAISKLRLQTGLDGDPLGLPPRYLVVPAALEAVALQLARDLTAAAKITDINPYGGTLEVLVEPRLDATSATAWYLVSDQSQALEVAYLAGAEGPQIETRAGFDVDGMEFKCRLDFAASFVDHRGWIKSAGV